MFLLDANVLISSNQRYYPLGRVPEFWEWLRHQGEQGHAKMPVEIVDEIRGGDDDLAHWLGEEANLAALLLDEDVDPALVTRVIEEGYAPDLTDEELAAVGQDPFLIAAALAAPQARCVITTEVSKPTKIRQNRRVPDVCATLGVRCLDNFAMLNDLDFTTGWKAHVPALPPAEE